MCPALRDRTPTATANPAGRVDVYGWPVERWHADEFADEVEEFISDLRPVYLRGSQRPARRARLAHLRRKYVARNYGFVGKTHFQARAELRLIPPGTTVLPYLVNGVGADTWVWRDLENKLGLDRKAPWSPGPPLAWEPAMAEWAPLSRWAVFDAGDELLEHIRKERTMRVGRYSTAAGPGVLIAPTGPPKRPTTWMRVEAQPEHEFGMSWPTRWGPEKVVHRFLADGSPADDEDSAVVVTPNGGRESMSAAALVLALSAGGFDEILFVRIESEDAAVTWSASKFDSDYGSIANEITYSAESFSNDRVHRLLGETLLNGSRTFVDDALQEAAVHLRG